MKSFRFRPEGVLDLRRRRRDVAQAALGAAARALQHAEAEWLSKIAECDEATEAYRLSLSADGDVTVHERHRNWIVRVRADVEHLRGAVDERRKGVDTAATALRSAHQDVRVLERLKAHQQQRHHELVRQEELKDMNEIASLQYTRRMREGDQHGR